MLGAGKRTAFEQYEAQLYEELVGLIGETGVLHTALDRALKLEVEVLTRAADPIASTTARLEKLSSATGSGITSPVSSSAPYGTSQAGGYSPVSGHTGGYGQGAQTGGYVPAGGHTGGYPQAPSIPSHGMASCFPGRNNLPPPPLLLPPPFLHMSSSQPSKRYQQSSEFHPPPPSQREYKHRQKHKRYWHQARKFS